MCRGAPPNLNIKAIRINICGIISIKESLWPSSKKLPVKGPQLNVVIPVRKYKAENQNKSTPEEKALNNKYLIEASTPANGLLPREVLYFKPLGCKPHKTKKQKF